jgi:5-methylcytosine-specific restriction endonuclease McrA
VNVIGTMVQLEDELGSEFDIVDWRALTWSHRQQHLISERDGWTCAYCGINIVCTCFEEGRWGVPGTVDHRVPQSQGGGNALDNLVLACRTCNTIKGTRLPEVMFA